MKKILYQDESFILEAEKDEFNNLRLTQIFIQGEHKAIDSVLLPQNQQLELMKYLNELIK